ncbi:MAG: hypothetical protein M3N34_09895, partial [Pseudomonadota bacterium]|nr:hypothetical protein [Pseudomonadota bacterium]
MANHVFRPALLTVAASALVLAAMPVQARDRLTGEQQLAKMLEGRVAEKPVNCISLLTGNENTTVIDK